ncbi:Xaa-Pro aminopeptidase [Bradyrhizobium elkanii]
MWSEDVFREDSQINIELSGHRHNYVAEIMRTFSIGAPSERLRRLHESEVSHLGAALSAVKPGHTYSDVANAFYRTIEERGFKKGVTLRLRNWHRLDETYGEPRGWRCDEVEAEHDFPSDAGYWIDDDFGYVISETFASPRLAPKYRPKRRQGFSSYDRELLSFFEKTTVGFI